MTYKTRVYAVSTVLVVGGGLTEGIADEGTGYLIGILLGCFGILHLWHHDLKGLPPDT